jgi:D-alanine-D-alanine ligase
MKILILHDHVSDTARPDESDTLEQVRAVRQALEFLGHKWMTLGLTLDLEAARIALDQLRPDLVFNLVESLHGIGRFIHVPLHLLDALRIPYTGVSAEGMLLTSNKLQGKRVLQAAGIAIPRWFTQDSLSNPPAKPGANGFAPKRFIVKSVWEHASIGLSDASIVDADSAEALGDAIDQRADDLGGEAFAEEYIDGREFNLALLAEGGDDHFHVPENARTSSAPPRGQDPELLPPCEIVFDHYDRDKPRIVNYSAKWDEHSFEYAHTPRRYEFPAHDQPLLERMKNIALRCWQAFDLHGHARVDFRVDEQGNPFVLEVNANPCLSPDAGFAAALQLAGISSVDAIQRIVADVPSARRMARQSAFAK